MSIRLVATRALLAEKLDAARSAGASVGFVPTMGYLHEGHGSLVDASVACSDLTVVSVFVNPLQFGVGEDLDSYPTDLDADMELCGSRGASILFHPGVEEVYPEVPVQPAVPGADCVGGVRGGGGSRHPRARRASDPGSGPAGAGGMQVRPRSPDRQPWGGGEVTPPGQACDP